jgi:hypothetical protein
MDCRGICSSPGRSPRTRGSTAPVGEAPAYELPLPARPGLNLASSRCPAAPRARGAQPGKTSAMGDKNGRSPHARAEPTIKFLFGPASSRSPHGAEPVKPQRWAVSPFRSPHTHAGLNPAGLSIGMSPGAAPRTRGAEPSNCASMCSSSAPPPRRSGAQPSLVRLGGVPQVRSPHTRGST